MPANDKWTLGLYASAVMVLMGHAPEPDPAWVPRTKRDNVKAAGLNAGTVVTMLKDICTRQAAAKGRRGRRSCGLARVLS